MRRTAIPVLLPMIIMIIGNIILLNVVQITFGGVQEAPAMLLTYLSSLFPLTLLFISISQLRNRHLPLRAIIFGENQKLLKQVSLGLAIGIILAILVYLLFDAYARIGIAPKGQFNYNQLLYLATIHAIIPAVGEELYFRGALFEKLKNRSSGSILILSSLSFSLWHVMTPMYMLHTFLIGIVLGKVVQKNNDLITPIIAHFIANSAYAIILISGLNN